MNERERIGRRIAELRKELGLTQAELAEHCGMAPGNIARIETGRYSTGIDILSRIAQELGKKIDFMDNNK